MFTLRSPNNFTFGTPQHTNHLIKNAGGTLYNMSRMDMGGSPARTTGGTTMNWQPATRTSMFPTAGTAQPPTTAPAPATPAPATPAPVEAQPTEQDNFFNQDNMQGYYTPTDERLMAERAAQFREIYEQPQRQALTRQLEEAIMNAENQEGKIRANYAGYMDMMNQHMDRQRGLDLESAIARGAGRSGVVNYDTEKRSAAFAPQISGTYAQKMSELNAIENQLAMQRQQVPRELQELAEQASRLEAQELQRLMDLDYQRGADYDRDMFERSLQTFDRSRLTPLEQLQMYLGMADVAGKFPGSPPDAYGGIPSGVSGTSAR